MTRPVVHFEIRGRDPAKLRAFYTALFGWTIDADNPMHYGFIEPGVGGPEAGVGAGIVQADAPSVSVYVQVADLRETLRRAEELGGQALTQPIDVPGGPTVAQARDPEGNIVGLVQQ